MKIFNFLKKSRKLSENKVSDDSIQPEEKETSLLNQRRKIISELNSKLINMGFDSFNLQVGNNDGNELETVYIISQTRRNEYVDAFSNSYKSIL